MQDLGEDFRALEQAWPRAVEEGVAVGKEDVVRANRTQILPDLVAGKRLHFPRGLVDVVPAGSDQDHVRVGGRDLLPGDPWRRLAVLAERADAAGDRNQ